MLPMSDKYNLIQLLLTSQKKSKFLKIKNNIYFKTHHHFDEKLLRTQLSLTVSLISLTSISKVDTSPYESSQVCQMIFST